MKKAENIISIVLYVFAGLLTIYSVWALVHSYKYISEAISAGQLATSGNEFDIVNFYMSNSAQYIIFAVILFSMGWLFRRQSTPAPAERVTSRKEPPSEFADLLNSQKDEDDLDEWFKEMTNDK